MDNSTIENPKVFISYAWGTEEYQAKVLKFAGELRKVGIDVMIDKWDMKEGHDKDSFMERCVNDETITNVLILLDENYAKKANARSGGAGAETQIISAKIYNQVKQEKFIPIVFERDFNGDICKPTYLNSLLHFDLSQENQFDFQYEKLIRRLYGKETYVKPELGNKPEWVEYQQSVSTKTINKHSSLKMNQPDKIKAEQFIEYTSQIKEQIINFKKDDKPNIRNHGDYIALYAEMKDIRDEFLSLIKYTSYVNDGEYIIADLLEEIYNEMNKSGIIKEVQHTLLHEMFIYVIAAYFKAKKYDALGYTLSKTYFNIDKLVNGGNGFNIFYFHNENLDKAIKDRDSKNYTCGTAQYWIDNINIDICSKDEFVFADMLCYHYSILGSYYHSSWNWFPITYIYGGGQNKILQSFAIKLQSKEHLIKASKIFGYENIEMFQKHIAEIEVEFQNGKFKDMRYPNTFDSSPFIFLYIKSKDVGISK